MKQRAVAWVLAGAVTGASAGCASRPVQLTAIVAGTAVTVLGIAMATRKCNDQGFDIGCGIDHQMGPVFIGVGALVAGTAAVVAATTPSPSSAPESVRPLAWSGPPGSPGPAGLPPAPAPPPPLPDPASVEMGRAAWDAARGGDCDTARAWLRELYARDRAYYAAFVATNPIACRD